jgi:citrate lyase subunit beta/citryl-CoA lyase
VNSEVPVWRSLLYVPTHMEKFVSKAHTRGADAIILDLEDAVPLDQKELARSVVQDAAVQVSQSGADVVVRINRPLSLAVRDVEAAVSPSVKALSLPKVESAGQIQLLDELVSEVEIQRGMPVGQTLFLVLIESAQGLSLMAEIAAASSRVAAMTIGGEDLSADIGMESGEDTLFLPKQMMIQACARADIMPIGVIGAIAGLDDGDAYLEMAKRSRRFGYVGSSCVHPKQVPVLNQAFTPDDDEFDYATRVVEKAAEAEKAGKGAIVLDGKMIDAPVVTRARNTLARKAAIEARVARQD